MLPIEPDWFTAFDEQKAQKEAAYRLKVSTPYTGQYARDKVVLTYPQQEAEAKLKRQERLKQLKERLGSNGWRAKKRVRL